MAEAHEPESRTAGARPDRLLGPDRLSFLLAFVPWLASRDRATVAEAAERFGVPQELVRQTVRLVAMSGLPGRGPWSEPLPDEMFDIDWDAFEERDELVLTQLLDLGTAPRFSSREAAAIIAGLQYLAALPESADSARITALLDKLSRSSSATPLQLGAAATGADPGLLALIREAAERSVQLEFDYLSERGERERRTVDPLRVESADQHWYLRAWCHLREAVRTFRLDRIAEVLVTDLPITRSASEVPLGDALFSPAGDEQDVVVELAEAALPLLGDFLIDAVVEQLGAGRVRATLRVSHVHGVKRLAARMPGLLTVVAPVQAREAVRSWAEAGLALYR